MNHFNITYHLKSKAETSPNDNALLLPNSDCTDFRKISFKQLDRYSDAFGQHLENSGAIRGNTALVMVRPGLELIGIAFALLKKGIVPVLMDPGMGLRPFLQCIERTKPDYLIGITPAIILSKLLPKSFRSIKKNFWVKEGTLQRTLSQLPNPSPDIFAARKDDLAAILFTSGSTGPAKGVCYSYGIFSAQIERVRNQFGIEEGEVDLPMLPIFALFNPALGMTTVVPKMNPAKPAKANPKWIINCIKAAHVTNSFGSPVLWNKINQYAGDNNIVFPELKRVLIAGAAVPHKLVSSLKQKMPNGVIYTPYGATECLPVCGISDQEILSRNPSEGTGTLLGKPVDGIEIKIIQPHEGIISSIQDIIEVKENNVGEIIIKGDIVTKEYYKLPEQTQSSKILDNGELWHRIGDLGYRDEEGFLWFAGRKVERIITGENEIYYTDFVEKRVNQLDGIYRSALIPLTVNSKLLPAIAVELYDTKALKKPHRILEWDKKILAHLKSDPITARIEHIFYWKQFPVDVRHNAKIHRRAMSKGIRADKRIY